MTTTATGLELSVAKTNQWIDQMAEELDTDDSKYALRLLRAYLHTLRDRLGVNEAAQLAAQMPDVLRGVYYANWVPSRVPTKYHDAEGFLTAIAEEAQLAGTTEASFAVSAGSAVLRAHISSGEIDDIVAALPAQVGALLDE